MVAKGMLHRETILADGSVANTRVSARILKKWASKCQRTDPHFPPAEGDECKSMDEGWDDDDFSSTLQLDMFLNPGPGDNGDEPEEDEDEDMHSYAAAAGYQNEPPLDVASLSSGAPLGLGAVVHDPLEAALERLPTLLDYELALLELDSILQKPRTRTSFDLVVVWLEAALRDNTFKDLSKLPRRNSLMKHLNAKFCTPPHELKTVALETGREEGGVDDDKICMTMTRLACNRAIESSYWRMDNDLDVGLLMGYVLYRLPVELEFMDLKTSPLIRIALFSAHKLIRQDTAVLHQAIIV
jgi:hypothetical protein